VTSDAAWLGRCAWRLRSSEFGALRYARDRDSEPVAAMEYMPGGADDVAWAQTRRRWVRLPGNVDNVIPAVADAPGEPLLLRYAAIDWRHARPKIGRDPETARRVASQAFELGAARAKHGGRARAAARDVARDP